MNRHCWILRIATAVTGCAILIGISLIGYRLPAALGYCLNLTPSEPVGVYRLVAGGAQRGALVWLKQPVGPAASILHRYAPTKIPLIKRVAAISGDIVQVGTLGVRIDGTLWPDSVPLDRDAEGRSLRPYPFATYRVRAQQLWVCRTIREGSTVVTSAPSRKPVSYRGSSQSSSGRVLPRLRRSRSLTSYPSRP